MSALLSKTQWAEQLGVTTKTVERWLAVGLPAAAVRQGGRWFFPAGTPRPTPEEVDAATGATSRDVASAAAPSSTAITASVAAGPALGVGGSLAQAAAALGCSPRGLRRLYADMQANPGLPFYIGRYGPHGALHVVAVPRG